MENLEDSGKRGECGKSDKAKQSQRAGQSRVERTMGAPERNRTRKEAKLSTGEPKKMKIHGGDESREAEAESEGLEKDEEKKNMNKVKENKESKTHTIRNKATKRWENKLQKTYSREWSQRSVKKGEKARDLEDGTTGRPAALEKDSDDQGEFSLHYLFIVFICSPVQCWK